VTVDHRDQRRFAMRKLVGMKQILCGSLLFGGLAVLAIAQTAFATPVIGVEGTSLAVGTFDGLEARSQTDVHEVELRATGLTDVHVLQNKIAPGGTFGWHSHPGPSIVVVQSGVLTLYRAGDPDCTAQEYAAGSGFVDRRGGPVPSQQRSRTRTLPHPPTTSHQCRRPHGARRSCFSNYGAALHLIATMPIQIPPLRRVQSKHPSLLP